MVRGMVRKSRANSRTFPFRLGRFHAGGTHEPLNLRPSPLSPPSACSEERREACHSALPPAISSRRTELPGQPMRTILHWRVYMYDLAGNLRYSMRQFRLSPVFTATAILTLALGIGGTTAIFSLMHAVMMRSLPVADPARLYRV